MLLSIGVCSKGPLLRSWFVVRWHRRVLVGLLVLGLLAVAVVSFVARDAAGHSDAEMFDCSVLEARSFDAAGPKARACEADVEVVGERSSSQTMWATPRGTTRLEVASVPVRTDVSGPWADIDPVVEGTPGESVLSVASPVYPIELNAGGSAGSGQPLGSITREDGRLDVWFPAELPVPELQGSRVSYDLAEGVRLVVSINAQASGFVPVVVLADAQAYERFRVLVDQHPTTGGSTGSGDLVFSTKLSEGLRLSLDHDGSVRMLDEAGEVAFFSPPPLMWDSAGGSVDAAAVGDEPGSVDRVTAPGLGDRVESMRAEVRDSQIVVTPDSGMVTSPDTVWPVYIDPGFTANLAAERVAIRTGGYTGTLYNWDTVGGEGAGYCTDLATCNTTFKQRLIWEYSDLSLITSLASSDIISAGFTVYGTHSASCTATTTDLHMLGNVSAATTWGSLEWADANRIDSRTEYHSASCGNAGWRTFNVTSAARTFADNDSWSTLSLGLKARDESSMTSWKRFGHDAKLSVEFNRAPNIPTGMMMTSPVAQCDGWVASLTPQLSAVMSDPDGGNLNPQFTVVTAGNGNDVRWDSGWMQVIGASQSRFTSTVPSGVLVDGNSYAFHARGGDGARGGEWSPWCGFSVDVTKPVIPVVAAGAVGIQAVYLPDLERGGVGLAGTFALDRGSSSDVVAFRYGFNDPSTPSSISVAGDGSASVSFTPTSAGPVTLTVVSVDRAGNRSSPREYRFKVASPVEDVIWKLDENTGSSAANSGPKVAGPLTVSGAGWVAGPHQVFGSRGDDWALSFDGVNDAASSGGPVLDTSKSFTVSAHVLLTGSKLGLGDYTVLSQDGLTQSAFRLGYRANCGDGGDCWSFGMPDTSSGATVVSATSATVTADEWVHLVGEHDATNKTVRLWVCEVGTPARLATGDPLGSAPVLRGGSAWRSPGAFAVGRGQAGGTSAGWWPGRIDNVRVFSGQVTDASKLRRLCQGAEAEDFGQGTGAFDAVDPTVGEQ
ncbi:LamG-like jellyroll fold domain-containing protein [Agromyces sp. PvR057]|uniref:LamG-like jellyroll fold domain-containing protein n=1 Tax=Agromyces sp. PvR057 TaxID=3156403 RepID=UPI003392A4A9